MPEHKSFQKIHDKMVNEYGKKKGDSVYYAWLKKHGYDDKKDASQQMPGGESWREKLEILNEEYKQGDTVKILKGPIGSTPIGTITAVNNGKYDITFKGDVNDIGNNEPGNNWWVPEDSLARRAESLKHSWRERFNTIAEMTISTAIKENILKENREFYAPKETDYKPELLFNPGTIGPGLFTGPFRKAIKISGSKQSTVKAEAQARLHKAIAEYKSIAKKIHDMEKSGELKKWDASLGLKLRMELHEAKENADYWYTRLEWAKKGYLFTVTGESFHAEDLTMATAPGAYTTKIPDKKKERFREDAYYAAIGEVDKLGDVAFVGKVAEIFIKHKLKGEDLKDAIEYLKQNYGLQPKDAEFIMDSVLRKEGLTMSKESVVKRGDYKGVKYEIHKDGLWYFARVGKNQFDWDVHTAEKAEELTKKAIDNGEHKTESFREKLAVLREASPSAIIKLGEEMSGGWGYWGHLVRRGSVKDVADKAWIAGLKQKGYDDLAIALYGYFSDGRHIADELYRETHDENDKQRPDNNMSKLTKIVAQGADSISSVREEIAKAGYVAELPNWAFNTFRPEILKYYGMPKESVHTESVKHRESSVETSIKSWKGNHYFIEITEYVENRPPMKVYLIDVYHQQGATMTPIETYDFVSKAQSLAKFNALKAKYERLDKVKSQAYVKEANRSMKRKVLNESLVADKIMAIGDGILLKYGKTSGTAIEKEPLRGEFKKSVKPLLSQITPSVLAELEDNNYHTELLILMKDFGLKYGDNLR